MTKDYSTDFGQVTMNNVEFKDNDIVYTVVVAKECIDYVFK